MRGARRSKLSLGLTGRVLEVRNSPSLAGSESLGAVSAGGSAGRHSWVTAPREHSAELVLFFLKALLDKNPLVAALLLACS